MKLAIHLAAPNDRNGNPRRAYLILNELGCAVAFYEEGYKGCHAVPPGLRPAAAMAPRINVSASELRSWKLAVPSSAEV
ncbi:MAG: hypothetical protein RLZZ515_1784 [Cyanobacteriota bacterium]